MTLISTCVKARLTPERMQIGKSEILALKNSTAEGGTPVRPSPDASDEGDAGQTPSNPVADAGGGNAIVTGGGGSAMTPVFWLLLLVLSRRLKVRNAQRRS